MTDQNEPTGKKPKRERKPKQDRAVEATAEVQRAQALEDAYDISTMAPEKPATPKGVKRLGGAMLPKSEYQKALAAVGGKEAKPAKAKKPVVEADLLGTTVKMFSKDEADELIELAPLTEAEAAERDDLEATIRSGIVEFMKTGQALARMRDGKLYKDRFTSFGAYVDEAWGFTRQRAYQLISAATVAKAMSTGVDIPNEATARLLVSKLKRPEDRRAAMVVALATAPDGKLSKSWLESTISVIEDARATEGFVDDGNGDWAAMNAAITAEAHAKMMAKKNQLRTGKLEAAAIFVVSGSVLSEALADLLDTRLSAKKQYRVVIYPVEEKPEASI